MPGQIAEAFIRIRADTSGFEREAGAGIKRGLASAAQGGRQGLLDMAADIRATIDASKAQTKANQDLSSSFDVTTTSASRLGLGLKAGLVGLGVTAAFQAVNELTDSLRVTGAEATTTEGKFRNLGAELLSGNLIGAIKALRVEPQLAANELERLTQASLAAGNQTELDGLRARAASKGWEQLAGQLRSVSAAVSAITGARAVEAQRIQIGTVTVRTGLRGAAAEVAQFGEREGRFGRGPSAVAEERSRRASDLPGLRLAIAQKKAEDAKTTALLDEGLANDLKAQQQIERLAKQRLERELKGSENYREQFAVFVREHQNTVGIQNQIESQRAAAAAGQASLASSATAGARRATQESASALRQSLSNQEAELRLASDAVGSRGKTARRLIAFLRQESRDARLTTGERLGFAKELAAERKKQTEAQREVVRDNLDYRKSVLELNIRNAQLTDDANSDDEKATRRLIRFLERQKKLAKTREEKLKLAGEITGARLSLKGLRGGGGTGAAVEDFYRAAIANFQQFGSNITPGLGGILSPQDVRGSLATATLSNTRFGVARSLAPRPSTTTIGSGQTRAATRATFTDPLIGVELQIARQQASRDNALLAENRRQTILLRRIVGRERPLAAGIDKARDQATFIHGS